MLGYADELQTLWDNALVGAVHNQQGKGNVAQGEQAVKFQRSEYWHPNMSAYEVTLVERIADRELDTTDNYIDEANKWLYKKTGNNTYFALYSTSHTSNPTVLYACKGKRAENEYAWFMNFLYETERGKDAGNDIQRKLLTRCLSISGMHWTEAMYIVGSLSEEGIVEMLEYITIHQEFDQAKLSSNAYEILARYKRKETM